MKIINTDIVIAFLSRQKRDIGERGWQELVRKFKCGLPILKRSPCLIFEAPLAVMILLIIYSLRPFFIVRFQQFYDFRIGHFAANTELYMCELDANINRPSKPFIDIWYHSHHIVNEQLRKIWKRKLKVGPSNLLRLVDGFNSLIIPGRIHQIGTNTYHDRDTYNLLDSLPSHVDFLPEEEEEGRFRLQDMGISKAARFVCLIVRDSEYLSNHPVCNDTRRHSFRDCSVNNYVMAAYELVNRGYYVVRMGSLVREEFKIKHPMVIDYAANGRRSDFMDIYLGANCTFCVSTGTGYDAVPNIFRRPIVFVDHVSLGCIHTSSKRFLSTTKKHWLPQKNRLMSFKEIFESGAAYFSHSLEYEEMGIQLIESTPDEIRDIVIEMDDRLNNRWHDTMEDVILQERFKKLFIQYAPKNMHGQFHTTMSSKWLRKHRELLN